MPDKPLTIATYAAGASLAAITLVYVFAPTFFLDGGAGGSEDARGGRSARRLVVGLVNPANDCFINSVLQALAGLPELRKYLIREVHRRALDGDMYSGAGTSKEVDARAWKAEGLRRGVVTRALKEILDRLNERPIYRKTISAQEFVAQLERAFNTHISRQQQDAQEFLQVVTERLGEEYAAGVKARRALRDGGGDEKEEDEADGDKKETEKDEEEEEESGFPFSGQLKSQIECETCNFKPTPTLSSFVTLILNVPQRSATTLNHCFDGMLKIEHIDDFKCDKCRLLHALDLKSREKDRTRDPTRAAALESEISAINHALASDPEHPPPAANLPARSLAPQRRIKRSIRISRFPKILAIHLSRSIYTTAPPTKNTAKVAFPEHLPLGGVLSQTHYRLLALVTHKGGHNSGHYESFRRQVTAGLPFSTPHSFGAQGPFSRRPGAVPSPNPDRDGDADDGPELDPEAEGEGESEADSPSTMSSDLVSTPPSTTLSSRTSSSASTVTPSTTPTPSAAPSARTSLAPASPVPSTAPSAASRSTSSRSTHASAPPSAPSVTLVPLPTSPAKVKKRRDDKRWWRISDDRVRESKTAEVLGMQKEVYLLFYEVDEEWRRGRG